MQTDSGLTQPLVGIKGTARVNTVDESVAIWMYLSLKFEQSVEIVWINFR